MLLCCALLGYWVLLIVGTLAVSCVPNLRHWSLHGKVLSDQSHPPQNGESGALKPLNVFFLRLPAWMPKKRFRDFYLVGAIWCCVLYFKGSVVLGSSLNSHITPAVQAPPALLVFYIAHVLRRYYEERFVVGQDRVENTRQKAPQGPRFSGEGLKDVHQSYMHIMGYLLGLSFYVFYPLSLVWDASRCPTTSIHGRSEMPLSMSIIGLMIFIGLMYAQYWCHCVLGELKRKRQAELNVEHWATPQRARRRPPYPLPPYKGMFKLCASPHYLCEIGIYAWFAIATHVQCTRSLFVWNSPSCYTFLCCIFVILALSINGLRNLQYYRKWYPQLSYCRRVKAAVLPYLL